MGEHRPEAEQRGGRERHPERGQIPLEERLHEITTPDHAVGPGASEVRAGESTSQPEPVGRLCADLREAEARERDELKTAGETLGRLAEKLR
jgi:hypothetical protein